MRLDTPRRIALYREMRRIRLVEERIAALYPEQEIRCPTHLCIGQEAIPVGVSTHLRPDDMVFSAHRSHGHYLAKGGDLTAMLAELYGKETGCAGGKGGSQHLVDLKVNFMGSAPILASTIPVAVGAAWASKMRGEDRVTVVYFGDGATEEGAFYEALNFAALHKLAALFVCEDNGYSVHSARNVRRYVDCHLVGICRSFGISANELDGNDVEKVVDQSGTAIGFARSGTGPVFLRFSTYRFREHCGPNPDGELPYRPAGEYETALLRCPVETYRQTLTAAGALSGEALATIDDEIRTEIDAAVAAAKVAPFPAPEMLARHVYP